MKKQKTFTICAKLGIEVTTAVKAENYEEAIAQARQLRADDFVNLPDNCWMNGDVDKIAFISEDD